MRAVGIYGIYLSRLCSFFLGGGVDLNRMQNMVINTDIFLTTSRKLLFKITAAQIYDPYLGRLRNFWSI